MKSILLVVATTDELEALKRLLVLEPHRSSFLNYFVCTNFEPKLIVMQGGIGKAGMSFRLGYILSLFHFDFVVNTGVCGSIDPNISSMDTIVCDKTSYYDVFIPGEERGQICDLPKWFHCSDTFIRLAKEIDKKAKVGHIVTGDMFVTEFNMPDDLDIDFDNPIGIDMESAAVGQCCHIAGIPFAIIRTISDSTLEKGNEEEYDKNVDLASTKALKLTISVLKNISKKIVL